LSTASNILLAFYGDDFTGSTDALEFIATAGGRCVLFIEPPDAEALKKFPGINVVGVAGKTRAMPPDEMEEELMQAFTALQLLAPMQLHYKVCSTFDSAPHIGSIGKAIECGKAVCHHQLVSILGGMPALGRYCVFGNLFATMGTGTNGTAWRLDRHPSMSRHPVTPAEESDLRLHLARQTNTRIGLISITQLHNDVAEWGALISKTDEAILADACTVDHLLQFGKWLHHQYLQKQHTVFSVGSSGVEMALGKCWQELGILQPVQSFPEITPVESLLVLSGSCSPVTAAQISSALQNGFTEVIIHPEENEIDLNRIITLLQAGHHVIVHTGERRSAQLPSEQLGSLLGSIAVAAVKATGIQRVVIAGGDTSSHAARAMNITAVEILSPLVPGAPLCIAHSPDEDINGLQVNFKGGQVGTATYFELVQKGKV